MAYTKYSLTPANNNAAPPNGAPEGMLPSAVNDTMRDMMAQVRDVGDGIRDGTYTMTAPVITGGSITGVALSGNTLTNPVITGAAISTSTLTGNTFTNPVISGGSINNTPIGASTANTGAFTTLSASSTATLNTLVSSGATITGGTISGVTLSATSPNFTTPILGTPTSGALTNCTGLPVSTGISGLGTGVSTFLATPSSANLKTAVTDETGSGALVFATSPTLVTPVLGTPSSGTLTSCTGLPVSTGISGLGANVATFLATPSSANLASAVTDETGSGALVFATSPALTTPNLGTPSAATLTNATGLPVATGISGLGSGVATFLATPSSANLRTAVTDETGSGALVFATSPTLVTPVLGVATATSVQGIIGNVTPAAGTFTTLTANGNTTLGDAAGDITTVPDLKALQVTSADRHSVRPSLLLDFANTKTLDPRITFTRASTASFYDGKTVAKAEENLFLQSQALATTPWTGNNATATNNTVVAPDGTTTASTITEALTTNFHLVSQGVAAVGSGNTYTYSCYGKNNTGQYLILGAYTGTSTYASAIFDLSGGTVSSSGAAGSGWSVTSTSITSVGNGWYRCVITFVSGAAAPNLAVGLSNSTIIGLYGLVSYLGTGNSIYVWGAQLEARSSVTAYTATTTAAITNYIPALQTAASGVARFEHNPTTGESLGLEIEEQRTNLHLQSQTLGTTWTATNVTIASDTVIAPDGTLTADKLVETGTTSQKYINQLISCTSGTAYTFSCYAKASGRNFLYMGFSAFNSVFNGANVYFNLSTGAVGTTGTGITASIQSVGNGWYRCIATQTASATASGTVVFGPTTADGTLSYAGDSFSGVFLWGMQAEAGAFATSYIPTVASQVTRSADAASMTGTNFSSWYRADEGTLYTESQLPTLQTGGNPRVASLSDNTNNNEMSTLYALGTPALGFNAKVNNSFVAILSTTVASSAITSASKNAAAYRVNDFAMSVNGATVATDTAGAIPIVNRLNIGAGPIDISGSQGINGNIRKIAYYAKRLTNAELVSLTTI